MVDAEVWQRRDEMRTWGRTTSVKQQKTRLPFLLITLAFLSVVLASCAVATLGSHSVTVTAWDRKVDLVTSARTVRDALAEANVVLGPNDHCSPDPDAALTQGLEIKVVRASIAFVHYDGKVQAVETSRETVGEILSESGIAVGSEDSVVPGIGEPLPDSRRIRVVRVTYADVIQEEAVPYAVERREDSSLEAGLTRVYRNGVAGVARVLYRVRYEDGVEVSRDEISREKIKDPSSQILLVGSLREVSRGGTSIRFERAIEALSTAYCPCAKCCGSNATGMTSTGLRAERGVIAVDPRIIPLGSRVYVDGYGFAIAADVGSAIKGNRVDVCFNTHEEALAWGMKRTKVYVID